MIPVALSMDLSMWNLLSKITLIHVFASLGLLCFVYMSFLCLISLFKGIYSTFLGQLIGNNVDLAKMGQWAVVTGATDGLGKAYVEELAKMGINIVLISRSGEKLKEVASSIREEFDVSTRIIAVDFTDGPEIYNVIKKNLQGLEIGVLINNVGMSYPYPELITQLPNGDKFLMDLINCNCVSCTMMCRIVLPGMAARKKGVVLNLSSGASCLPHPMLSVYSASKIYVDHLSKSLSYEYRGTGIIIQSVVPFYVTTKMSKIRVRSFFVPTPTEYVRAQLQTVGLELRTYGPLAHKIRGFLTETSLYYFHYLHPIIFTYINYSSRTARDTYLRKKQKFAKIQ